MSAPEPDPDLIPELINEELTMTWTSFHSRGATLRSVIATANSRRDGLLPMDVPGVAENFDGEADLLATLQLKWQTRLAGLIERRLAPQPWDLDAAVAAAWQDARDEMPGVRAVIDHYRLEPVDDVSARHMRIAEHKEHVMLAVMAGRSNVADDLAAPIGAAIEHRARAERILLDVEDDAVEALPEVRFIDRLRQVLAA